MFSFVNVEKGVTGVSDFTFSALKTTDQLLSSTKESYRVYGVRRLARLGAEQSVGILFQIRAEDSSLLVRGSVDKALVSVCRNHKEFSINVLTRLVECATTQDCNAGGSRSEMGDTLKTVGEIISRNGIAAKVSEKILQPIHELLEERLLFAERSFDEKSERAMEPRPQGSEEMPAKDFGDVLNWEYDSTFTAPELYAALDAAGFLTEVRRDIAVALAHISGRGADALRVAVLEDFYPSNSSAHLILKSIARHVRTSEALQEKLSKVEACWKKEFGGNPSYASTFKLLQQCRRGAAS